MTNLQSIRNKFDEFKHIISQQKPKLIAVTESWCNDTTDGAEIFIPNYTVYRRDRKSRVGGGVLLYVHHSLPVTVAKNLNNLNIEESLWCLISISQSIKILVGVIYRSPSSSIENNDSERLLSALDNLKSYQPYTDLLLVGNFNVPDIDWPNNNALVGENTFTTKFFNLT